MNKEIEIEIPTTPNFIKTKGGTKTFAIAEFSDDELRKIGYEWTENLIKKTRERAENFRAII